MNTQWNKHSYFAALDWASDHHDITVVDRHGAIDCSAPAEAAPSMAVQRPQPDALQDAESEDNPEPIQPRMGGLREAVLRE